MFQRGPGEGYGAYAKEAVREKYPHARCRRMHVGVRNLRYMVFATPAAEIKGKALGGGPNAVQAWMNAEAATRNK